MPLEFVVSVSVTAGVEVANRPLAPVDGAVKVTETPIVGVPFVVTVATNGLVNAALTIALCPPPLVAVMFIVGCGFMLELDEPQLVRKPMARQTRALVKMPEKMLT
jgi:hypothetical protein